MNQIRVSVIACYNKIDILNDYLDKSLSKQSIDVERIYINNKELNLNSASSCLNHGASISNGDYLIFAHQDISFEDPDFIRKAVQFTDVADDAILGIAGKKVEDFKIYSNMLHGEKKWKAGNYQILDLEPVQTLDEVFIMMKRSTYDKVRFDEEGLTNWHLYAVDLCLAAAQLNIKSYVMPLEAYHLSTGNIDKSFYDELNKVVKKHRSEFPTIASTCVNTSTNPLKYEFYKIRMKVTSVLMRVARNIKRFVVNLS